LRPVVAERLLVGGPQVEQLGIAAEVTAMAADGSLDAVSEGMPDAWIDNVAVVGTPEDCDAAIRALSAAGADAVVLVPPTPDVAAERLGCELAPLLEQ
jgi:5,10-methylenetetrahydromethanopterin reductase